MNLTIATSFVNGAVAMLFLIYGTYFLRISAPNRLKHIFGWSMLLWSVLLSKDVLFVTEYLDHDSTLYKGLMMLDNCAVVTCNIYVIELLRPGRLNWKYILFNFAFPISMTTLLWYVLTAQVSLQFPFYPVM